MRKYFVCDGRMVERGLEQGEEGGGEPVGRCPDLGGQVRKAEKTPSVAGDVVISIWEWLGVIFQSSKGPRTRDCSKGEPRALRREKSGRETHMAVRSISADSLE